MSNLGENTIPEKEGNQGVTNEQKPDENQAPSEHSDSKDSNKEDGPEENVADNPEEPPKNEDPPKDEEKPKEEEPPKKEEPPADEGPSAEDQAREKGEQAKECMKENIEHLIAGP